MIGVPNRSQIGIAVGVKLIGVPNCSQIGIAVEVKLISVPNWIYIIGFDRKDACSHTFTTPPGLYSHMPF